MHIRNIPKYLQLISGIKPNETLGFRLLALLARRFVPGYRLTWPELVWFQNPALKTVLTQFGEDEGFNAHRRFAIQQLLRLTVGVPGDTAECGVYKGCGSHIILSANKKSSLPRVHHIFDSFEGLSEPVSSDGEYWTANDLAISELDVTKNLSEFKDFKFYKGWIPSRFGDVDRHTFSFVHVDVDLYEPTLSSLNFFYSRITKGGVFICDDYGFKTCPGATTAIEEFLISKPEKMISLPGGGGFFIKGCLTAAE